VGEGAGGAATRFAALPPRPWSREGGRELREGAVVLGGGGAVVDCGGVRCFAAAPVTEAGCIASSDEV